MKTEQDKINDIINNMSQEEYDATVAELELIPSFAGHENYPLTDRQRAVMTMQAAEKYKELFDIWKLDYKNDPNLKSTPARISTMMSSELMIGRYQEAPRIESFPADKDLVHAIDDIETADTFLSDVDNFENYMQQEILISKRVDVQSMCSHHFMPFYNNDINAYAVIAYKPSKNDTKYLGISKLQRIVNWYASRPQLQENLTMQIFNHICRVLNSKDVLVCMKNLTHTCESLRGVNTICGKTSTILYGGIFRDSQIRLESISLAI